MFYRPDEDCHESVVSAGNFLYPKGIQCTWREEECIIMHTYRSVCLDLVWKFKPRTHFSSFSLKCEFTAAQIFKSCFRKGRRSLSLHA